MYIIIWEYQVRPEKQTEFEKIYASYGAWAELFKKGNGCLGTELIHSTENPAQYLTAAYLTGRIHVTGGEDLFHNTVSNQHQVLDLTTMVWEQWSDLPGGRHGLTSQAVDGKWIVIGGSPIPNIGMSNRVDIFIP